MAAMERAAEATVWAAGYATGSPRFASAEEALRGWRLARKAEDDAREAQREANEKELEGAIANARGDL